MSDRYESKLHLFKDHVLTTLLEAPGMKVFRLGKPNDSDMFVRLIFTGDQLSEQIVLSGDACIGPTQHGLVSNIGYGLNWFAWKKGANYLCEKFLRTTWCPDYALECLKDSAAQIRLDEVDEDHDVGERAKNAKRLEQLDEAIESAGSDDFDDVTRTSETYWEFYSDVFGDYPEDDGIAYDTDDAATLVAIQWRFAECYQAMIAAEKTTAEAVTK